VDHGRGEIGFSKQFGFLDSGGDCEGILAELDTKLHYGGIVGEMPFLHSLVAKNPLVQYFTANTSHIVTFCETQIQEHLRSGLNEHKHQRDLTQRILEAKEKWPDVMNMDVVRALVIDNVLAGSDTTAVVIRSIFYYLLKNPPTISKLLEEIDELDNKGELDEFVTWKQANSMPYLGAVIKEAMRIHPVFGQLLEREVPKGGVELDGYYLPEGTIVGVNPWVAARNKDVYGEDVETFRPERWIESAPEQLRLMERTDIGFGRGSRYCLGKHITLLEVYKLVPQLLRHYEFTFVDPEKEWQFFGGWFVIQLDFDVFVKRRSKTGA